MKTRLKICQVCFSDAWGGLEMSARDYTRYLKNLGHDSSCLCKAGTPLHEHLKKENLAHRAFKIICRYSPLKILAIRRFLQARETQIVHLHNPRDLWLITPALWGLKHIKLFATSRMFFSRIKKKDPLHKLLYSRIDKFINTTRKSQEQMQKNLPLPAEKHLVIPNAVDLQRFQPELYSRGIFRSEIGVKDNSILLGLIGRIDPGKGQKETIQAMPEIIKEFPETRLVIVGEVTRGEHEGFMAELKSLVKSLNLENHVIWAGFKENIPQVLKDLDIFIMPSYQESFGKVLVEAMSMKIAVIATNKGGPPEIIANGSCGILIKPACSKDISEAVLRYLTDNILRKNNIDNALKRVRSQYALEVVLESIEQLYFNTVKS